MPILLMGLALLPFLLAAAPSVDALGVVAVFLGGSLAVVALGLGAERAVGALR